MSTTADEMDYEDDPPHPKYSYRRSENNGSARRIAEALVIGALLALGGSVWLLRESVAVLQATQKQFQDFTQMNIADIKSRQDRMEGRIFRGGSYVGDVHADERQSQ